MGGARRGRLWPPTSGEQQHLAIVYDSLERESAQAVLPLLHAATGWPLDLVLGGPGLEEDFLQRSVRVEVGPGVRVPMIAAEDLIVTKVLAGRPKDLEDAQGILAAQGADLDADAVRTTLAMLEDALGVSDLLPVFERLNRR